MQQVRPADRPRQPLRRPGHRQGRRLRPRRQDHPRRHRPRRAGQGAPPRRADRRRLPPGHRGAHQGDPPGRRASDVTTPDRTALESTISGWQEKLPAGLRAAGEGDALKPQIVLEQLRDSSARRHDRRARASASTRCGQPVLEVRPPLHLGQLRRARHHGLLGARRHRRQGRSPRPHRVGGRRRRLLPDDRAGAGHRLHRAHPGQDRHPQQRLPRHGAPVAGDVLRGALLRGVPVARPARLREVGRGHGLRRHPGRVARGGPARHRQGERDRRPARRGRVPHRRPEKVFPMVAGRSQQRRHRGARRSRRGQAR